jgi:hypothetical protein
VSLAGYRTWPFALAGLVFVAAGIGFFLFFRHNATTGRDRGIGRVVGSLLLVLYGAGWSFAAWSGTQGEYANLTTSLHNRHYLVVEGPVTAFRREGYGGHPPESWTVDGHHYTISSAVVTSGFGTPGLVHQGDSLRIADVDGTIARIERREVEISEHVP